MAREMVRALNAHKRLTVVGTARNGAEGRRLAQQLQPDVITLDVNMPDIDGLTCLQYIMIEQPTPCVIVSALTGESACETFEAYELGAVGVVQKPTRLQGDSLALFKRRLAANVVRASYADVSKVAGRVTPPPRIATRGAPLSSRIARRLVVIGASTGGPRTLLEIVPKLPPNLGAAVMVVQHMPGSFTGSFAERLDGISALPVVEAQEGQVIASDCVYLAPGDFHLRLQPAGVGRKAVVRLSPEDDEDLMVVPSVDVTLDSALTIYGSSMVGVVLTGLGSDGAKAMKRLHDLGGVTIAESEDTAVIYGMPKAVVEAGAASYILPAHKIAEEIVKHTRARPDHD